MPFRGRLLAFVIAIVANLLAGLVATPVVICQLGREQPATAAALVCTCRHGTDGQCAMHKHHRSPASPSPTSTNKNTWCAGCQDRAEMIMTALTGVAAPLGDRAAFPPPDVRPVVVRAFSEPLLDGVHPPLSPPPRRG